MKKRDYSGYLYILPFFMVMLFFWYIPILMSGWFSLTEYNALSTPVFAGFANYKALLQDKNQCIADTL